MSRDNDLGENGSSVDDTAQGERVEGLISIVMPCFNAAEHLHDSVDSALNQTYKDVELLVVDDGSTDSTPAILKRMERLDSRLRYLSQENRGAGPARNHGLLQARGEFVAFLDADDYWDPTCLEKLHSALSTSKTEIAYCGWQNIGVSGGRGEPFVPPDYAAVDLEEAFLSSCLWPIHGVLARRCAIERVGGFDERWSSCMDYDLWLRLSSFVTVVLVPEVLAFYRHYEGDRITSNRFRIAKNHWMIQKEFLRCHPEVSRRLGRKRVRDLVDGELLKRGFVCYWGRDLESARSIFRLALWSGSVKYRDYIYVLQAFLPLRLQRVLLELIDSRRVS